LWLSFYQFCFLLNTICVRHASWKKTIEIILVWTKWKYKLGVAFQETKFGVPCKQHFVNLISSRSSESLHDDMYYFCTSHSALSLGQPSCINNECGVLTNLAAKVFLQSRRCYSFLLLTSSLNVCHILVHFYTKEQ
jgi:hypothetical protein